MLALTEKQMLIQALGQVICETVESSVSPIIDRLAQCEKILGDLPVPKDGRDGIDGKDGHDGKDGKDADMDFVRSALLQAKIESEKLVARAIAALPKPEKGDKGERGEPGQPGKDGRDGIDGVDGKSVQLDDVRAYLADLVAKAVANIPLPRNCVGGYIDRAGHLFLSFSDGCNSDLGEVVGRDGKDCDLELARSQVAAFLATIEKPKDGKDGKDGMDGVGFDDLQLEHDGGRIVTFKFVKGDNAKVFNLSFPVPLDQGIWKQGEYEKADMVQRDGSMWMAKKDTATVPGAPDSDWRLSTKRGRDGKAGERGPAGPAGKDGRNGRDLTQVGPDGSKW